MEEIRVLHILSSVVYRGAENVVCQIIHMFGNDPKYKMFYASPDGEVRPSLEEQGVDYHPLKSMNPWEIARVIREVKPTVVHAHDMRASLYTAMACGSIPLISHIHINNIDSRTVTPKALAYVPAGRKAKRIFWVSQSAFDGYFYKDKFADKSLVLQNVIDPDMLCAKADRDKEAEKYDVVYVGAIEAQKNPRRLGEVLAQVLRRRPGTRIAVIGSGSEEPALRESLAQDGALEQVNLLGFRRNPYGLLSRAGVMVMTSDYEGTPMVALEALTLGVPIVTTPVDGMLDLVEPEVNGLLSWQTDELAEGVIRILDDEALRLRLSDGAKAKAAALLDVEKYRVVLDETYKSCVK